MAKSEISAEEVRAMRFTFKHPNAYLHNGWSRPRTYHPWRALTYELDTRVVGALGRENGPYDRVDLIAELAAEALIVAKRRARAAAAA